MQMFQRPSAPKAPAAAPPPPNLDLVYKAQQQGQLQARQANDRASTILTNAEPPDDQVGVINKKQAY